MKAKRNLRERRPFAREVAAAMKEAAAGAERNAVVERFMAELSCSRETVYRWARSGGWSAGRRQRSDRGKRSLDKRQLDNVIKMIVKSKRKDRACIMDAATALDVAVDSGMAAPVSTSTLNRYLREERCSRSQLAWDIDQGPHVNLISLHPNHVHQFDISPCIQYFFDDKGKGLGHRDMKTEFYLGKPENIRKIKRHLLRFVLVDHFSNAVFIQYYYASGEKASDVADFLLAAWGGRRGLQPLAEGSDQDNKESSKRRGLYPFRGLPNILICDRGSAAMSEMVTRLLEALEVERLAHLPGNPRAKGSVEGMMHLWQTKFESRLSIEPAPDLETLNLWARDFLCRFNGEFILGRAKTTRSQLWSTITQEELRLLPPLEACQELVRTREVERTVAGNLLIKYLGSEWRVPSPDLEGRKVTVSINPYTWLAEDGRRSVIVIDVEGRRYEAREVRRDPVSGFRTGEKTAVIGEEFTRHAYTSTQDKVSEISDKELPDNLVVFGHHADKLDNLRHVSPRGEEHELEPQEAPEISVTEALKLIRQELGRPLTEEEAEAVRIEQRLTRARAQALATQFLTAEAQRTQREEEEII